MKVTVKRNYELMILVNNELNDLELKNWTFRYCKYLRRYNILDVSVISRGNRKLSYEIKDKSKGSYVQLNFSSLPKYADNFLLRLKTDAKVIRGLLTLKKKELIEN